MANPQVVLVLQGGGALGAYQGGVFTGLAEHGVKFDWVVGTSIGAINGAIIAGNPPEVRAEKLESFWQQITADEPPVLTYWSEAWLGPLANAARVLGTLLNGVPGFFLPRRNVGLDLARSVPICEASFYDTSPLEATLENFVDFDYLNAGNVRFTVCAVDVATGALEPFDNRKRNGKHTRITPRHVMASGALPPGFPPVQIGKRVYWDGGIYSNTPIDIVLDDAERRDTLCFMVDLWDPSEVVPASIAGAITRQKDIQYASRSREHLDDHRTMQNLRRAVRLLCHRIPAEARKSAEVKALADLGSDCSINIVRLIMKALPGDDHLKDIDFSPATVTARWNAGRHDAERVFRHKSWLKPLPPHIGMAIHELTQE